MPSITPHITITDAIYWQSQKWIADAAADLHKQATAKADVLKLIAIIPNEMLQHSYLDAICRQYKWKGTETKAQFKKIADQQLPTTNHQPQTTNDDGEVIEIDDPEKFPKWAKPYFEQWKDDGFITCNTTVQNKKQVGFYFINAKRDESDGKIIYTTEHFSNFIAEPVMHVYNGPESLFIFKIQNHRLHSIIEVPAANIPSPELFQKSCIGEGNFMIFGSALKWKRIASALLEKFTRCIAIPFLGWQADGFFAFVNGAYIPGIGWQPVDENGIVTHKNEQFLIPASSQVYLKTQGRNTDAYESDRPLHFHLSTNNYQLPSFSQWAIQTHKVYGDTGLLMIATIPMALMRDVIFNVDNNCPLIYFFGEPSSGKSKAAESINAVFYKKRMAFNVNSGTDHAFFSYMQRFINTPAWLNEVDEATLKPEWFQALKGAFDGESRERGRIVAGKLKTEIQKILSLIILTGQKLITADDNSLVTRSLIEGFSKAESRTENQINEYNQLKQWEEDGLTHLLADILQHRKIWADDYKETFNSFLGTWRRQSNELRTANQRIVQNWCHASVNYSILSEMFALPVSAEYFNEWCQQKAVKWSKFISTSDVLSEFWATLQNLVNTGLIKEGWDYIVQVVPAVKIDDQDKVLGQPTQVLFMRMGNIHPLYERDSRSRGKNPMSKENLLHYLSSRQYFLGSVRSKKFHKYITVAAENNAGDAFNNFQKVESVVSCHALIYESLNIEITNNTELDNELFFKN